MPAKGDPHPAEQTIFIGIGSNQDSTNSILRGVALLHSRLCITAASRFYRNPAVHPRLPEHSLPAFVNGILQAGTSLPPADVKSNLLRWVERECGRIRSRDRYAPRTLDLDLLVYGDLIVRTEDLRVPDPDILVHAFLAVPLAELAPDLVPAISDRSMEEIAEQMDADSLTEDVSLTKAVRRLVS
jgi:dihydroneopterin aldolase/2-amino-4-hydroxy-6-hydroxymethyldihydropteridine diphosphokinase